MRVGRRGFAQCQRGLGIGLLGMVGWAVPMMAQDLASPDRTAVPRSAAQSARVAATTAPSTDFTKAEPFETKSAGAATVPARPDRQAFAQPFANLPPDQDLDFIAGQGLFRKIWVAAPSSTLASDGLGPQFNARSCEACHAGGGRGHLAGDSGKAALGLVLHIAIAAPDGSAETDIEAYFAKIGAQYTPTRPHPVYGAQLQDFSIQGQRADFYLTMTYQDKTLDLSGGETATLRAPTYHTDDLAYDPLGEGAMVSPRIAPQMIGLGLLEAIAPADILAAADETDADGDGISGRAQIVWSWQQARPMLGRFGHKAGAATLRDQSALAFHTDIGISTPLFPAGAGDCTAAQTACQSAPNGNSGTPEQTEIGDLGLDLVTLYASTLAVPARRNVDAPDVLRGKQIFYETGCPACHTPKFVTQTLPDHPERSFQLIWPYSDLLLHDMGPGLADDLPEGVALGREWRTAPLWGIGLTAAVSGQPTYLHDGRARSLLEAILWHGGESEPAKNRIIAMPAADRAAVITFLESL